MTSPNPSLIWGADLQLYFGFLSLQYDADHQIQDEFGFAIHFTFTLPHMQINMVSAIRVRYHLPFFCSFKAQVEVSYCLLQVVIGWASPGPTYPSLHWPNLDCVLGL